jgi:hypothetical protein
VQTCSRAQPARQVGGGGEQADEEDRLDVALEGQQIAHQRRRVVEIDRPGAAGGSGDGEPDVCFSALRDALPMLDRAGGRA